MTLHNIMFQFLMVRLVSRWQHPPRTAHQLGETTAAYPVPPTPRTPANRTAASAAGWPFGLTRPRRRLKTSATRLLRCRCRARRSLLSAGPRPNPPGSSWKSAVRARLTAASPPAAIPPTPEVSLPTQAAWISTPGRTSAPCSACLPTWLTT